jgi:general secretion pathway protein L
MLIITPASTVASADTARVWDWVRSADGRAVSQHGSGLSTQLPKGGECVLVLPPSTIRWHHIQLPAHPAAKRAAVLTSVLDEWVLGEPEQLHAALPESAPVTQALWCAVVSKPWLGALLADLRLAGVTPHRIVPMLSPDNAPQALVWPWQDAWRLSIATPQGVLHTSASQDLATLAPDDEAVPLALQNLRCPSALAGAAEQAWPTLQLQVRSTQALLLDAAQSAWNLAQFELKVSATQRRGQALWRGWTEFWYAPAWRMTRLGVIVALLGALVIPPAMAWRERQAMAEATQSARELVQRSFADIRLVIDPVVQMRRGVQALAASKGLSNSPSITVALTQLSTLDKASVTRLSWQNKAWLIRLSGNPTPAQVNQALRDSGWSAKPGADQTWTLQTDKGTP